ncbi:enoyl-CoA hydratase/carnithine racemase [Frondihabitans sp. PhB188]|uniref:crotonase/enoyl-CoA hydratase family protein n=1 Tax=Frondihabitans sp. PhB188 TaxID=2485200 RepID=UPI000F4A9CAC|nr:crotonase/enoyl-CoA hydratase family protein [Frondihabitans sp. PhB188]ROQ41317.1 enoyl-CoA hydratase/carnithine racemase [Frondihabitans sp. PhB188]
MSPAPPPGAHAPRTKSQLAALDDDRPRVTVEVDGHVLLIGLDREEKRNAADLRMLHELALAYGRLESDPDLWCGLVSARGEHFTAGLDLGNVAAAITPEGLDAVPEGGINPWQVDGVQLTKPVVLAVQGTCLTLGVELALVSDIVVAGKNARFGQMEVRRGILPFGGATTRFPARVGWGNAMRWMLTGDLFDAREALRIGLVQEVVLNDQIYNRAYDIAHRIARMAAPLAVQAVLANAHLAESSGEAAAHAILQSELVRLLATEDAAIGMKSFQARGDATFIGR